MTTSNRTITIGATNSFTAIFTNTIPLETLTAGGVTQEVPVGTPLVLVNGLYRTNHVFANTNPVSFTITSSISGAQLFYTLDGSDPVSSVTAKQWTNAVTLTNPVRVSAIAYTPDFSSYVTNDPVTVNVLPVYPLAATTKGGGALTIDLPSGPYLSNTVVTLTATPQAGWTFLGWTGDATGTNNPLPVTMIRAKSIQAVFGTPLGITPNSFGTITASPATNFYAFGSTVRLSALPVAGRYFLNWGGAASGSSLSPLDFVVTNATNEIGRAHV